MFDPDLDRDRDRDRDDAVDGDPLEAIAPPGGASLVCRSCETPITERSAAFSPGDGPSSRVLFNPAGVLMQVLTVQTARNLIRVGPRTAEFSWFPGTTWQVVVCAGCARQLGWHYQTEHGDRGGVRGAGGATPAGGFWGLLERELVERDAFSGPKD